MNGNAIQGWLTAAIVMGVGLVAGCATDTMRPAPDYQALVAGADRTDGDRAIDVRRKPAELLAFYGVRPGMTGWWQVAGRSEIQYPERAHLDIYYVKQWSLALDFKILLLTLPAVLRRSGAF